MKLGHTIEDSRKKHPELTDELLNELRAWSEENGVSGIPDAQLGIFAHSCYYDVEATKKCMSVYYRLRSTVPELFANRDPMNDTIQQACKTCVVFALPVPDNYGNKVILHRLLDYRPSSYVLRDSMKALMMAIDASLYNDGCTPGYVFLLDMMGVKLGHLSRISLGTIRTVFEYVQDGVPLRLKAIHVVNCVWFVDKVLALFRPFMNRKFFNMVHIHTGEISEIYEYIEPKCLPKDYGGELEPAATLHAEHWAKFDELRDYFCEEERLFRCWSCKASGERRRPSTALSDSETEDKTANKTIDGGA